MEEQKQLNKSLYELELEFYELMLLIEDNEGEITEEVEKKLAINIEELEYKVKGYSFFINKMKAEKIAISEEIQRLRKLADSKDKFIDRLKRSLVNATKLYGTIGKSGNHVLELDTIRLYTRKSSSIEVEDGFTNSDYIKYGLKDFVSKEEFIEIVKVLEKEVESVLKIDKQLIKADLKAGVEIEGVKTIVKENIIIK